MSSTVNLANAVGSNGGTVITGTSAITPDTGKTWFCFTPTQNTVIAAISCTGLTNSSSLVGLTIAAGVTIFAPRITSITLMQGAGVALNNVA